MIQLILSILALVIGVSIYPVIKNRTSLLSFFDAFVLIAIPGLTLLHLIPHSIENTGLAGWIAVCLGFGIPGIIHHLQHHSHDEDKHEEHEEAPHSDAHLHRHKPHALLILIVFLGVMIHTILDGIGLSMTSGSNEALNAHGQLLALGVLFHRLPIGIFLGLIMVPMIGFAKTLGVAIAFSAGTCIGFILGHFALPHAGISLLYLFQGLIAGTLLHIIFHNVSSGRQKPLANGLGALFGIAALIIIEKVAPVHQHDHGSVLDTWLNYLVQATPMWCIACILLGLLYLISNRTDGRLARFSAKLLQFLDPQPTPAGFDGKHHLVSALGIICLFTLFNPAASLCWWIAGVTVISAAACAFHKFRLCSECYEPHICAQHKSILIWTQSSWMCLILISLLASVMPSFVMPLTESIESMPVWASWILLIASCLGILAVFGKNRGLRMPGAILLMFALSAIFYHLPHAIIPIAFTGIAAIWLYDFHPRDIRESIEDNAHWQKRYIITAALGSVLIFSGMGLADHYLNQPEPPIVMELAHHHEHSELHEHEHGELHEHEHGDLHEHEHGELHEHEHGDLHEHAHEHGDLDEYHHDDLDEHVDISVETFRGTSLLRTVSLAIFLIMGLIWLLRFGPRELFEIATGHRHHKHEPEE